MTTMQSLPHRAKYLRKRLVVVAIGMAGTCSCAVGAASYKLETVVRTSSGNYPYSINGTAADFQTLSAAAIDLQTPVATIFPFNNAYAQVDARPEPKVVAGITGPYSNQEKYEYIGSESHLSYGLNILAPEGFSAPIPVKFSAKFEVTAAVDPATFQGRGHVNASLFLKTTNEQLSISADASLNEWVLVPNPLFPPVELPPKKWRSSFDTFSSALGNTVDRHVSIVGRELHWGIAPDMRQQQISSYIDEGAFDFEEIIRGTFHVTTPSIQVSIGASTYLSNSGGELRSFVDPYFYIDPEFLAIYPEISLMVEPNFGNTPKLPVPEASSTALFVFGVAVIAFHSSSRLRKYPTRATPLLT